MTPRLPSLPRPTAVRHVMTPDVVTVSPETAFKEIVQVLSRRRIGAVPVVSDGVLMGVVSEADLMLKSERLVTLIHDEADPVARQVQRRKALGTTAGEVMSSPAVTIGPDASLNEAVRAMLAYSVKHLVVVDGPGVVGIISRGDVLSTYLVDDSVIRRHVLDWLDHDWLPVEPAHLEVGVDAGVVTLSGRVSSPDVAASLVRLVALFDGVVSVEDRLEWSSVEAGLPVLR